MGNNGPLQLFGDFGFVGGEDVAPNYLQNNQTCINFYAEVDQQNPKEVLALLGCPGLVQLVAAPGGGVPTTGVPIQTTSLTQIFETSMSAPTWTTGANFYSSTTVNTPIIVGVGGGGNITLINRNFAANSQANSAGDGNIYTYSTTSGAATGSSAQSGASTALKNWSLWQDNWAGVVTDHTGAHAFRPYYVMATSDGNHVLQGGADTLVLNSNFGASSLFVAQIWSVLTALSGWGGASFKQAYPCADFQHIFVRSSVGWAIVNVTGGTAVVTSSGTFASDNWTGGCFGTLIPGGGCSSSAFNNVMSGGPGAIGCLQTDLKTLWLLGVFAQPGQMLMLQITGTVMAATLGQTGTSGSPAGTQAFPSSNACAVTNQPGAIWADQGLCAMQAGQELTLWSWGPIVAPGQWPQPSAITNLPVRGAWELPNDQTALAVIGNTCYLVTIATPAVGPPSPPSFATLALTSVGTLLTNTGQVHIRDNNIGGYAVIVDGPYGYLYNIKTQAFSRITDPAFLGADTVAFIDGWWIFNQPGTQTFYTQAVQYGITFNASNFALKDSSADMLRAVFENKEQLWLIGDKTTEIWYDAGGQYFAFQRLVGTPLQVGCKAAHSVARFSSGGQDGLMWFGRSERGENVIVRTKGFSFDVVSTPAFGDELATYPITSDAIAYTYQEDTHEFYMLTFPTQDVTWCYDSQSGLLHKRLSYDPYLQQFHRHRSNCFMNFQGMRIVGDYQCGSLHQLTRAAQTDAGWPLWSRRRSPHIWDKGQRGRTFMASVQVEFKSGVGNPSGQGVNPQAGIVISRDGGKTFGQRWPAPIGQIGQYKTRTMWRKLGFGRDNVIEIDVIDPVPRDIVGVTLKAFSSA
jgi:hypothetical protein